MELLRRMIFRTPGASESPVSEPPLAGPMPMGLPNNVTAGLAVDGVGMTPAILVEHGNPGNAQS